MPAAPPRRTQAERRAQTRAKLLKAAGAVFARRGYHEATLDEIADRAGLSKGALYYNFASKEDLFLALLADRLDARLGDAAGAGPRAFEAFVAALERDPRWAPLFFEFVAWSGRDARRRARLRERFILPARAHARGRRRRGVAVLARRARNHRQRARQRPAARAALRPRGRARRPRHAGAHRADRGRVWQLGGRVAQAEDSRARGGRHDAAQQARAL